MSEVKAFWLFVFGGSCAIAVLLFAIWFLVNDMFGHLTVEGIVKDMGKSSVVIQRAFDEGRESQMERETRNISRLGILELKNAAGYSPNDLSDDSASTLDDYYTGVIRIPDNLGRAI